MKTSLISRLSLLGLTLFLSSTMAKAQTTVYTEDPIIATSGYWNLETNPKTKDYTLVRFFNDDHQLVYQERLNGIYLDPLKSVATHRRIARMLGTALDQVQHMQSNSVLSDKVLSLHRTSLRMYAQR